MIRHITEVVEQADEYVIFQCPECSYRVKIGFNEKMETLDYGELTNEKREYISYLTEHKMHAEALAEANKIPLHSGTSGEFSVTTVNVKQVDKLDIWRKALE